MAKKSQHAEKKKRAERRRKNIVFLAVGIVVVLIIAGGWWIIATQNNTTAPKDDFSRERELDNVAGRADQEAQSKGASEGGKIYDEEIAKTADKREKSELMASKATLYLNEDKLDNALAIALEADGLYDSAEVSALVAQIYEAKGNKAKAAEFYRKAAKLVDIKLPQGLDDKDYFEDKAKELGGGR